MMTLLSIISCMRIKGRLSLCGLESLFNACDHHHATGVKCVINYSEKPIKDALVKTVVTITSIVHTSQL